MYIRALIKSAISFVLAAAVGAFMYLGPGRDWLSSATNRASDKMQEAADDDAGKAERDDAGNVSDSGKVEGSSLKVGDCLMASDLGATFYDAKVMPCTDAHDAQIVGEFYTSVTDANPTDNEMYDKCSAEVATYVGPGWESLPNLSIGVITESLTVNTKVRCYLGTTTNSPP